MPVSFAEPVSIVGETVRVSVRARARPTRACSSGAWRRRRHGAPVHAGDRAGFAERGIATLRYQVPYMEAGRKRTDPPGLAHATVRAAVAEAQRRFPELPLVAGGKSFGGRMTSQAQAAAPLPGVCGLVFLGFPLHPAKQPSTDRAKHLADVQVPMLFLQGTRDALAELDQLEPVCTALGTRATLRLFEAADHSFHVPARTGRKDAEVRAELLDVATEWISAICRH